MTPNSTPRKLTCVAVGAPTFTARVSSALSNETAFEVIRATPPDAWSQVISSHPECIILDIGHNHSDKLHYWMRQFLGNLRERFKQEIFVIATLSAPEKLAFGGDLLFAEAPSLEPSGFLNSFIALPPDGVPGLMGLDGQIRNSALLVAHNKDQQLHGRPTLPPLGDSAWAQSMADPTTLEMWLRWLPRYAGYTEENPLIIGETGAGKTRCAHALHVLSGRPGKFVSITPRDFSSSELVQAELFGAVAGAYTGAVEKWGLVKSAEKGTLFIDELQSIDKELQGKLITFIENKVYRRVGSAETVSADVRFVFASNRTLHDLMTSGDLRDDFAYRLERVQLELAPLRVRRLDIPAALAYALAKLHRQRPNAQSVFGITSTAYRMLFGHTWPGNLRQLENTVARLCEISDLDNQRLITERALSVVFQSKLAGAPLTTPEILAHAAYTLGENAMQGRISSLSECVEAIASLSRAEALAATGGNIEGAAALIQDDPAILKLFAATQSAGWSSPTSAKRNS